MKISFDEFKEQIKDANPIEEIASQYTHLKKEGPRLVGPSPFRSESDPSFNGSLKFKCTHLSLCPVKSREQEFYLTDCRYEKFSIYEKIA